MVSSRLNGPSGLNPGTICRSYGASRAGRPTRTHTDILAKQHARLKYKGTEVGEYYADIVVENQVILELKAVDSLQKIHEAQLLNYLKATGYKIGILVNFAHPKAEIKRYVI